jgi:hypothetical protein
MMDDAVHAAIQNCTSVFGPSLTVVVVFPSSVEAHHWATRIQTMIAATPYRGSEHLTTHTIAQKVICVSLAAFVRKPYQGNVLPFIDHAIWEGAASESQVQELLDQLDYLQATYHYD